jgi:DNA processing protein
MKRPRLRWLGRGMMMRKGSRYDVLLSLVFSGILPRKRIVAFLKGPHGSLARGAKWSGIADILNLAKDQRDALEKHLPEVSGISDRLSASGASIVTLADRNYPTLLKEIAVPPPLLFFKGSLDGLACGAVAIVGSRRASLAGRKLASQLAGQLAERGLIVVSGLARGIDTAAHRGALEAGGDTLAVMGCGIDVVYPPENQGLARSISDAGAVLTEFPPGTAPLRQNFPMRNRIISGLSLGTVVVEAGGTSGALITADFALEQNRSVFAVPGAPGVSGSKGTNRLLKQGARLVESAADILEEIEPQVARDGQPASCGAQDRQQGSGGQGPSSDRDGSGLNGGGLQREEQDVIDLLSDKPVHVDEISRALGSEAQVTLRVLFTLETRGLVVSLPGKFYVRERPLRCP